MELDAIREELAELHNSAFGWAMVCCGRDQDIAAEVLQQAYCRILGGDASFAGKSEFSTWVFGVIRNVAREEIRRCQRRQQRFQTIDLAQTKARDANHAGIEERELAEQLAAAQARLSGRQREVLHLTFYEDMTIEQAARVLEITVGSARKHYQRGKAALRRILATNRELDDERRQ
jgi:RNA polymerase sigma-70 factor (ECF subfamily)